LTSARQQKRHFVIIFVIIPALGNVNNFALLSVCTADGRHYAQDKQQTLATRTGKAGGS